jgi:hypothetical protein
MDGRTDGSTEGQMDRQTNGQKYRFTDRKMNRSTDRQTGGWTDRPMGGQTDAYFNDHLALLWWAWNKEPGTYLKIQRSTIVLSDIKLSVTFYLLL